MPDPIEVDFKQRHRDKAKAEQARAKAARKAAEAHRAAMPSDKAINWRAVPRFLMVAVPIMLALAALQWLVGRH